MAWGVENAGRPPNSAIRIARPGGVLNLSDALGAYKVLIDGAEIDHLKRKETKTYAVPPGHHTVQLKVGWGESQLVDVNLDPGEMVDFVARPGQPPGLNSWLPQRDRDHEIQLEGPRRASDPSP